MRRSKGGSQKPSDQPAHTEQELSESAERDSKPPASLGFETEIQWRGIRARRPAKAPEHVPESVENPSEGFEIDGGSAGDGEPPDGRT
jgi:hypothetical protein